MKLLKDFIANHEYVVRIAVFATIILSLPITILLVGRVQDYRQNAQYEAPDSGASCNADGDCTRTGGSTSGSGSGTGTSGTNTPRCGSDGYCTSCDTSGCRTYYDPIQDPNRTSTGGTGTGSTANPSCASNGYCTTCNTTGCRTYYDPIRDSSRQASGTGGTSNSTANCGTTQGCAYSSPNGSTIFCADGRCTECIGLTCSELPANRYPSSIANPPGSGWSSHNQGSSCGGPGCADGSVPPTTCANLSSCSPQCPATGGCNVVGPNGENLYFNSTQQGSGQNCNSQYCLSCTNGSCSLSRSAGTASSIPVSTTRDLPTSQLPPECSNLTTCIFSDGNSAYNCGRTSGGSYSCIITTTIPNPAGSNSHTEVLQASNLPQECAGKPNCSFSRNNNTYNCGDSGGGNYTCIVTSSTGIGSAIIPPGVTQNANGTITIGGITFSTDQYKKNSDGSITITIFADNVIVVRPNGTISLNGNEYPAGTQLGRNADGSIFIRSGTGTSIGGSNTPGMRICSNPDCTGRAENSCTGTSCVLCDIAGCHAVDKGYFDALRAQGRVPGLPSINTGTGTTTGGTAGGGRTIPIGNTCGNPTSCDPGESPATCPSDCGGTSSTACQYTPTNGLLCCGDSTCKSNPALCQSFCGQTSSSGSNTGGGGSTGTGTAPGGTGRSDGSSTGGSIPSNGSAGGNNTPGGSVPCTAGPGGIKCRSANLDSSGNSPTATPTLFSSSITPQYTPTSTVTPTHAAPTSTSTPTTTPLPGSTTLAISVILPGIGNTPGDTNNPIRRERQVTLSLLNSQNSEVKNASGTLVFDGAKYAGTINLGTDMTAGAYIIRVNMDNTLKKRSGILTINPGSTVQTQTTKLVTGDLNQDNTLNLADYNIMVTCIKNPSCPQKALADLNDDGKIEEIDVNILNRGFATRNGD